MKSVRLATIALSVAAVIVCSWFSPLDSPATEQIDAGLKRALVSFATARVMNGVISAVQGTELSAQPLGFGITLTPGQLLAPVNELVKHLSDLMLAASVAFGIQRVLISIGSYWLISFLLTAAALCWTWLYVQGQQPPAWLSKSLAILLMLRFAIPIVTIGTDLLSQRFLAADYVASQQAIDASSSHLAVLNPPAPEATSNLGTLDKVKEWFSKNSDVAVRFEKIKKAVEQTTEHIIRLMVIFALQTLVLPLVLLWVLYGVVKATFESPRRTVSSSNP